MDTLKTAEYRESWISDFLHLVHAVGCGHKVPQAFIDSAIDEPLCVLEAIRAWFEKHPLTPNVMLLDIKSRFYIASNLFDLCNSENQRYLLHDQSAVVRSAAMVSNHKLNAA